jgi:hypothetical protein
MLKQSIAAPCLESALDGQRLKDSELAADWKAAYDMVAEIMISAAEGDAAGRPPFWEATVVAHELRRFDIATFRVQTSTPLRYLPGPAWPAARAQRFSTWCLVLSAMAPAAAMSGSAAPSSRSVVPRWPITRSKCQSFSLGSPACAVRRSAPV